jgi:hypothetical protein
VIRVFRAFGVVENFWVEIATVAKGSLAMTVRGFFDTRP